MSTTCENCRFWSSFGNDEGYDEVIGTCLRYPPVRIAGPTKLGISIEPREWDQPVTRQTQRCGEHEPDHIPMGMEQVITWARYYVDGETCVEEVPRDELHPEERAGLDELKRLESLLPLHSPAQAPR